MDKAIYESASETAKKVRKMLKAEYPKTKFSVKSSTYSMGSSITVYFKDGVKPGAEIYEKVGYFSSKSFNGMDDSSSFNGYEYEGKIYNGADYVRYQA
jgi:hypothetical protein